MLKFEKEKIKGIHGMSYIASKSFLAILITDKKLQIV